MAGTALMAKGGQAEDATSQPNILYIHSHATGKYIQPYGVGLPTAHLQHVAGERASCRHGFSVNEYKQHMLHTLRPHGYRSTLIGVQHIAMNPAVIGYDEIIETAGVHVAQVAPAAARFLKQSPKQSFFLDIGF